MVLVKLKQIPWLNFLKSSSASSGVLAPDLKIKQNIVGRGYLLHHCSFFKKEIIYNIFTCFKIQMIQKTLELYYEKSPCFLSQPHTPFSECISIKTAYVVFQMESRP